VLWHRGRASKGPKYGKIIENPIQITPPRAPRRLTRTCCHPSPRLPYHHIQLSKSFMAPSMFLFTSSAIAVAFQLQQPHPTDKYHHMEASSKRGPGHPSPDLSTCSTHSIFIIRVAKSFNQSLFLYLTFMAIGKLDLVVCGRATNSHIALSVIRISRSESTASVFVCCVW